MRVEEAAKLMEIPAQLISEIIEEYNIDVERYINGNHDLDFSNMIQVYMIYKESHDVGIDWRKRYYRLYEKFRRLEEKLDPTEKRMRKPTVKKVMAKRIDNPQGKWYPRKHKSKNAEAIN